MSDRQADACSTENALHTRWAFDVTPGRERHVALQLQELGCTDVERPTKGYVIAHCDPTTVPVIKRLSGVVRALPLLDKGLNCCDPTAMVERLIGTPGISEPTNDPSHPSFDVSALAPPD